MKEIKFEHEGLVAEIGVSAEGEVFLFNLSRRKLERPEPLYPYRLCELQMAGFNQADHHGSKHTATGPGRLFRYESHEFSEKARGTELVLKQRFEDFELIYHLLFIKGLPAVESYAELINHGSETAPQLEYLSSFSLAGLSRGSSLPRDKGAKVHVPHSTWFGECQWRSYSLNELGYFITCEPQSNKRIAFSNTGSWACKEYLPMGVFEHEELGTVAWQINSPASWAWEISDFGHELYLKLSGANYSENFFARKLRPGERFVSDRACVCFAEGGFEEAMRIMTQYRRASRRPNPDNQAPKAIFNDYMNCLWGNPTLEKEYPLIDAAAELGCKYYTIDCGWYDSGFWFDSVGEWLPSPERFPDGIEPLLAYIRKKGMKPGLWLEIEVMGTRCPLADQVPASWFLQRDGRPLIAEGRYFLDFRNPEVRAHADRTVDRLVRDYGVDYIKNDYNVDCGPGSDFKADSPGDGLMRHSRAFLAWLDGVLGRYPELVIENCSSGGMRMAPPFLQRLSLQSVTDQTDYLKTAAIACNACTALPPEQAALWSYPLAEGDEEECIFNMVNAMLLRIHQSGHVSELSPERFALVREGIFYHHKIANKLKEALPFWPSGLADFNSPYLSFGLERGGEGWLAVWNIRETEAFGLRLPGWREVQAAYPANRRTDFSFDRAEGLLQLRLEPKTARVFYLKK